MPNNLSDINQLQAQEQAGETNLEPIPAGGSDPSRFDWQEAWYPLHYVADLDRSRPTPFTLLGRDIVIWWEKSSSTWRVFEDKCPHRLAPLSEGRITQDSLLECPYHGWTFSGSGNCQFIPQQGEGGKAECSKRASVISLPTIVRQGLLFAYPGNPENATKTSVPIVAPLEESPEEWICLNTFRDLPYDALTLLENVLDSSHIPFTHHGSVGNRVNASTVDLEILESGKQGFKGMWQEGPRKGKLGRQDTIFIAPGLMWHDLTSKQFGRTMTVVYATPTRKGECRLFARFPFKFSAKLPGLFIKLTPQWYSHIGQNAILEDDQIFLHHQERYLEEKGGSSNFTKAFYLPTKADLFVFEFRQWLNQFKAEPFADEKLPPKLSTEELLDRYHSHTVKCASCRTALANIKRLRMGLAIAIAIAWTILPLLIVFLGVAPIPTVTISTLLVLISLAAWLGLGNLEQKFYQGQHMAPRNLPEK